MRRRRNPHVGRAIRRQNQREAGAQISAGLSELMSRRIANDDGVANVLSINTPARSASEQQEAVTVNGAA